MAILQATRVWFNVLKTAVQPPCIQPMHQDGRTCGYYTIKSSKSNKVLWGHILKTFIFFPVDYSGVDGRYQRHTDQGSNETTDCKTDLTQQKRENTAGNKEQAA